MIRLNVSPSLGLVFAAEYVGLFFWGSYKYDILYPNLTCLNVIKY